MAPQAPVEFVAGVLRAPLAPRRKPTPPRGGPVKLGKRGADLLATVPLFSGLSKRHLKRVAELAFEVPFRRGATVVEAGMPGGTFYVILEGEANVVRGKRIVARLHPGDFFGEVSLLDGGRRTASVVGETPLVALRIHQREFVKLLTREPDVAIKILEELARRLREIERPLLG